MNFAEIDSNFKVETKIEKAGLKFYDSLSEPFKIHGIYYQVGKFRRIPEAVAEKTSPGVLGLHACTAGGRVRFMTDSPYVAINAMMERLSRMSHFAFTATLGFDLYADGEFIKSFVPPMAMTEGYESIIELGEAKMREITINFPIASYVRRLFIGVDKNAALKAAPEYSNSLPVIYYGSSITQGGCVSRPGMTYQSIVSRRFNIDFVNLGFSGNAKAEDSIVDYMAGLDMSMFVLDYDHNSPTVDHLRSTHEKAFKKIRAAHPDIPIIMMSRPKRRVDRNTLERKRIIMSTYHNAIASGDENVYFIDGYDLMALCGEEGTVDSVHPTDFGFASMAKAVGDLIEKHGLHLKLK